MRRHVSPQDCTSTSVSRPRTVVVVYGPDSPRRTSRHTGALFPGWVTERCCCALAGSSDPAGGFCCCANAAPATISERHSNRSFIAVPRAAPLAVDALVFVLPELALPDRILPARTVALGPLAAAQLRQRRIVVPRAIVGLALVLALLVDHDLLLLAAGAQCGNCGQHRRQDEGDSQCALGPDLPLFGADCCAGGCAPAFGGRPYAVLQPHTSEPRPRRSTR